MVLQGNWSSIHIFWFLYIATLHVDVCMSHLGCKDQLRSIGGSKWCGIELWEGYNPYAGRLYFMVVKIFYVLMENDFMIVVIYIYRLSVQGTKMGRRCDHNAINLQNGLKL